MKSARAIFRREGVAWAASERREVNRRSDLSRLLISEKTEYESRAIVYYRGRNGWDYSCCVKLNRPAAAATLHYVM